MSLLPKLKRKHVLVLPSGCWEWTGEINVSGYGMTRPPGDHGSKQRAHRLVWEFLVGPIPSGMTLDHECHNADRCLWSSQA